MITCALFVHLKTMMEARKDLSWSMCARPMCSRGKRSLSFVPAIWSLIPEA